MRPVSHIIGGRTRTIGEARVATTGVRLGFSAVSGIRLGLRYIGNLRLDKPFGFLVLKPSGVRFVVVSF